MRRVLVILFFLAVASNGANASRLAIISESARAAGAADVLTSAFSKQTNVAVLERAELQRVLGEQSLAGSVSERALQAGKILGADALLILEEIAGQKGRFWMRLIAVKPGALLRATEFSWPIEETGRWSSSVAEQYGAVLGNLAAPMLEPLKISLLNLRASVATAEAQQLEREATTLLLMRLAREPGVLALERRQLLAAGLEKDLLAASEEFWTGSLLLDGVINGDAIDAARVTIGLRLRGLNREPRVIRAEGARAKLPEIIQELSGKILKTVDRVESGGQWNPAQEAAKYLEEAEWASRWGMFPEARAAAEAAWALGMQNPEVAATRIIAYTRSGDERGTTYHIRDGSYLMLMPAPTPARLPWLAEGMSIAADYLRQNPQAIQNRRLFDSLCEALETSGDSLLRYYNLREAGAGREEELAAIRKACRSILPTFVKHPDVAMETPQRSVPPKPAFAKFRGSGFRIAFSYAALFYEKPEDVVPFYREFLAHSKVNDAGAYESIVRAPLQVLISRETYLPLFAGWKAENRLRVIEVEEAFAEELIATLNSNASSCGQWLQTRYASTAERPQERANSIALPKGPSEFGPGRSAIKEEDVVAAMKARRELDEKKLAVSPWNGTNGPGVGEALARMRLFEARREDSDILNSAQNREEMREALAEVAARRLARGETPPPPRPRPQVANTRMLTAEPLRSSDYWPIPFSQFSTAERGGPISMPRYRNGRIWVRAVYYYPDEIRDRFSIQRITLPGAGLLGVSPADWNWTFIPLVAPGPEPKVAHGSLASAFPKANQKNFEISEEAAWLINEGGLHRYDLKTRAWSVKPLLGEAGDLFLIAKRLYCSGANSIYEIKDDGARIEMLASVRRRPAVSALDEWPALNGPWLTGAPNGTIRAFFQDSAWRLGGAASREEISLSGSTLFPADTAGFYIWGTAPPEHASVITYLPARANAPLLAAHSSPQIASATTNQASAATELFVSINIVRNATPFMFGNRPALISMLGMTNMLLTIKSENAPDPVAMELQFELPARPNGMSIFAANPVLLTDSHLVFSPYNLPGFIKFSRAEIERRLDAAVADAKKERP